MIVVKHIYCAIMLTIFLMFKSESFGQNIAISNTLETALSLCNQKEYDKALIVCDNIIKKKDKRKIDAVYLKISIHEKLNHYSEMLNSYESLLKETVKQDDRNALKINILKIKIFELNDKAEVNNLLKLSRTSLPYSLIIRAKHLYAKALIKENRFIEAKAELEQYIKNYPNADFVLDAKESISLCDKEIIDEKKKTEKQILLIKERKATNILNIKPSRSSIILYEADLFRDTGQYKDAIRLYETVRFQGFGPELDKALKGLGDSHYALGDLPKAIEAWNSVLKLPANPSNSELRVSCLMSLGCVFLNDMMDSSKASSRFEEIVTQYPNSSNAVNASVKLAVALLYQQRPQEAERILMNAQLKRGKPTEFPFNEIERLLKMCQGKCLFLNSPKDRKLNSEVERLLRLAEIQFAAYDYKHALQAYEKVVKLGSARIEGSYALMQSARCLNQMGECAKAINIYNKFKEKPYVESQYADDALIRAGVIYVSYFNDIKSATTLFRFVMDNLQGGDMTPTAYMRLGTLLMWQQDWKQALEIHKQFILIYPDEPCVPFIKNVRIKEIEKALAKK